MNREEIKAKILEDIAAAKAQGFTLVSENWGDRHMKCACPLGCVNLVLGSYPEFQEEGGVMLALGVDDTWINSFIDGYDGNGEAKGSRVPDAWQIGAEIREELKPIPYDQFVDHMDQA
jgi:hypothetical protein